MKLPSSAYFNTRVAARCLQGGAAAILASSLLVVFYFLGAARWQDREFLFEPEIAPPSNQVVTPNRPILDHFHFVMELPPGKLMAGKQPHDFSVFTIPTDPKISFEVVKVEFIPKVKEQVISSTPAVLAILFDQSGSVVGDIFSGGSDPNGQRLVAAQHLVDQLPASVQIGVFAYGEFNESNPGTLKAGFDASRNQIKQVIQSLKGKEGGGTPTFEAIKTVISHMDAFTSNQKHILCFTDGEANDPNLMPEVEVLAKQHGILISFVALGNNADWTACKRLADSTGGIVVEAKDSSSLSGAFSNIASQIVKSDASFYRLTIRATRHGSQFTPGEQLVPLVKVKGSNTAPFEFNIAVQ